MSGIQSSMTALRLRTRYLTSVQHVRFKSTPSQPSPPHKHSIAQIPVDDVCIPLTPPYSISSYIPSNPIPLSRETLLKLHRLAALEPPAEDDAPAWQKLDQLGGLAAIIESVRSVDTSQFEPSSSSSSSSANLIDGRVRGEAVEFGQEPTLKTAGPSSGREQAGHEEEDPAEASGRALLRLAERTDGAYYTVPTPENIIGKRRNPKSGELVES